MLLYRTLQAHFWHAQIFVHMVSAPLCSGKLDSKNIDSLSERAAAE